MKKIIFKNFNFNTFKFFLTTLLIIGVIVWTLQAVNYFDYVTEDGHGLITYFKYTVLNFPKILHRLVPFVFFISLFYIISSYELRNELNIFWINGITKIEFMNNLVKFSIFLMVFQLMLGAYISPKSQLKSREYLKNSNIDFFTNLIRPGKFINVVKDLTIFINEKNQDGTFKDIFIEDTRVSSRIIFAKKGVVINSEDNKRFVLFNGKIINTENSTNIFDFEQIDLNLKNIDSKTITTPKIQEITTANLLKCNMNIYKNINSNNCSKDFSKDVRQELFKRIIKPFYIPIIAVICGFLVIKSTHSVAYKKNKYQIFFFTFIILVFSEASVRYSSSSDKLILIFTLVPILIFIISYFIFLKKNKYA